MAAPAVECTWIAAVHCPLHGDDSMHADETDRDATCIACGTHGAAGGDARLVTRARAARPPCPTPEARVWLSELLEHAVAVGMSAHEALGLLLSESALAADRADALFDAFDGAEMLS